MTDHLTDSEHRTVAELFLRAVDMPPAVRTAFLARACRGAMSVQAAVDALLRSAQLALQGAGTVVDDTPIDADAIADALHRFLVSTSKGEPPALGALRGSLDIDNGSRRLAELIKLDQKWRWSARQPKALEAYLREWPELRERPHLLIELLHSECLARAVYVSPATVGELELRFPEIAGRVKLQVVEAWARLAENALAWAAAAPIPVIPERFEIIRQIGEGGMGVVYEAVDRQRGARLALKTLPKMEPVPLYRFKREFRSLADLAHPNLVSLYELISDGSVWFFTMEFVDGVDFISHCRIPPQPPQTESSSPADATTSAYSGAHVMDYVGLRDALRQLAEGVRALHLAQIVHRDLKPSNVLVRPDGHVVILDFGLVKEIHSTDLLSDVPAGPASGVAPNLASWTKDHDVVGSVPYMAPEQAWRGDVTEASDWYSVGVMLYEALTGRLPFRGNSADVLVRKRLEDPEPPKALVTDIPDDLADLCMALVRREPHERPKADEVLARLVPTGRPSSTRTGRRRAPTGAFVGRESEVAALESAYAELERNVAVIVHIRGRSGAGKTALAQRYVGMLPSHAVVLAGRCYEQESVRYKALDSIVDDLCRRLMQLERADADLLIPPDIAALARIFPVMERVDAVREACQGRTEIPDVRELRRRAFGALGEIFHRLGSRAPLVLLIDDLQWGDVDSAALLLSFLESPDPPRLMLIACYRTEYADANPCLVALNASHNRLVSFDVEVGHLPFAHCVELATMLLGGSSAHAGAAERIARESGGNPYFVYELVRQLAFAKDEESESGASPDLDEALWRRVLTLPPSARHLIEVVAAAGKPITLRNAYEATDLGLQAPSALATLRAERLIRSTGPTIDDEIETYHDRIRESVTNHVSESAAVELHRRLALAFEAGANADVEATAAHFRRAGLPDRAAHYYALAGDKAAAALAFGRSAELYGLALQLGGETALGVRHLHRKRADALANAGRGYEAGLEYQKAAVEAERAQVIELERLAGYRYLRQRAHRRRAPGVRDGAGQLRHEAPAHAASGAPVPAAAAPAAGHARAPFSRAQRRRGAGGSAGTGRYPLVGRHGNDDHRSDPRRGVSDARSHPCAARGRAVPRRSRSGLGSRTHGDGRRTAQGARGRQTCGGRRPGPAPQRPSRQRHGADVDRGRGLLPRRFQALPRELRGSGAHLPQPLHGRLVGARNV